MISSGGWVFIASASSSFQPFAVALDDAQLQPLLDRFRPGALFRGRGLAVGEMGQQGVQRIVILAPAVIDQIFHDLDLFGRDQVQRRDLRHMDDSAGHTGPDRMVEEHRIQHMARRRIEAEGDVR